MSNLRDLAHAFADIAEEAGSIIRDIKRRGVDVLVKADRSPVTEADKEAERHIARALATLMPGVPLVAEEQASEGFIPETSSRFLLVDPLDGTAEFIAGRLEYTVNIALIEHGRPVAGVVVAPELARTFAGADGWAARRAGAGHPFQDIGTRSMAEPPVAVTSLNHCDRTTDDWLSRWPGVSRTSIGSSLKFALLAEGKADVYPRFGPTCEWDTAAGHAVLLAAGGVVLTPEGKPLTYAKTGYRNGPFIAWGRPPLDAA